ncbi:MAG: alpha/beta hydrolase [Actinobacteria bacterium]|nr:alpha/beta hydrolase [Actinomycetota bacterium]
MSKDKKTSADIAREYAVWPKDRAATAADGTRLAYTVVGDGPRTPVLFVNGWSCSDGYWAEIGPALVERGHKVIFADTRGHGQSGLPRSPGFCARNLRREDVMVETLALDVVSILDDAGIEKAALAGHSMGVQTIFETYRQAPDRVAALFPVAGTFENPVRTFADKAVLDSLYPVADVLFRFMPFELLRPVVRRTANPDLGHRVVQLIKVAGPKVRKESLAPHMAQIGEVNFSVLFKMMSEMRKHSCADILPNVHVPVLVLAGRLDLFTPPSVQQKMADLIPGNEIVWFEESGHMLPIEEPEGIVAAMSDFFARRVDTKKAAV